MVKNNKVYEESGEVELNWTWDKWKTNSLDKFTKN